MGLCLTLTLSKADSSDLQSLGMSAFRNLFPFNVKMGGVHFSIRPGDIFSHLHMATSFMRSKVPALYLNHSLQHFLP